MISVGQKTLLAALGSEGVGRLFDKLTTESATVKNAALQAFIVADDIVIFPRRKAAALRAITPKIVVPEIKCAALTVSGFDEKKLKGYQNVAVGHLERELRTGPGSAYLQLGTGLGKTVICAAMVAKMKVPTAVVCPSVAIAEQTVTELKTWLPSLKIGRAAPSADVEVFVVNTYRALSRPDVARFGLIVYDEVHEYATLENSKALWLGSKYMLGLSATPVRVDGLDRHIWHFLGKPIAAKTIPGVELSAVTFDVRVLPLRYASDREYSKPVLGDNGVLNGASIAQIARDPERVALIIDAVRRLSALGHGIFVFAEHRNILDNLKAALSAEKIDTVIEDDDDNSASSASVKLEVSVLRGGVKTTELERVKAAAPHVILTTYGYSRRGVSIRQMTAMVLATPRKNGLTQIIGRITRLGSDPKIPRIIVDIIDTASYLRKQYQTRRVVYLEDGVREVVTWPEIEAR